MKRNAIGGWSGFNIGAVILGFAFLYVPIALLMIYSFNESRLVTVWAGFSVKWYAEALSNQSLLDAAWVTVRIALVCATLATLLGTLAALALVRFGRFRGRLVFSALVVAPLVMPEVMTGLALLLLFVAMDMARGMGTIILAHTTFSMCFATVVIQSRLLSFDYSLEEAARDLGAGAVEAFLKITLPVIAPAMFAAWVLAFTLSLDDLVIANFNTGPGATTLPMKIFSQVRLGVTPEINAVCTILVIVVTIGVMGSAVVNKYRSGFYTSKTQ